MITYRPAEKKDFLDIAALDREAWGKNRNSDFIPDGEHIWRIWVEYAIVDCAFAGDKIIGVTLTTPTNDPKLYFFHKMFLDESYRQQGIGKKLLHQMLQRTDHLGVTNIYTTDTNNAVMKRLGESLGFYESDMIKGYYRSNEDRLIMRREPFAGEDKKSLNL